MPTYRPDFFGSILNKNGKPIAQVTIEAEIESTLFSEHTSEQLSQMDDFIRHQAKKRIRVFGYLVIPSGKTILNQARAALDAQFPEGTKISIMQFNA